MKITKLIALGVCVASLAACESGGIGLGSKNDKSVDRGFDSKSLTQLKAGIWVDPNGCHHWIIDDGVEGYLSERMLPDGRPLCSDTDPRNIATGDFKAGGSALLGDPI